jgi:hypothetical protein
MQCVQHPSPWRNIIINTTQQEQAISLHPPHHHHMAAGFGLKPAQLPHSPPHRHLRFSKMKLGQQDQAIRLSHTLGNQPLGIAVGKP